MWVVRNYSFTQIENEFCFSLIGKLKLSFSFIFMLLDKNKSVKSHHGLIPPLTSRGYQSISSVSPERISFMLKYKKEMGKHRRIHNFYCYYSDFIFPSGIFNIYFTETAKHQRIKLKEIKEFNYQNVFKWRTTFFHSIWFDHLFQYSLIIYRRSSWTRRLVLTLLTIIENMLKSVPRCPDTCVLLTSSSPWAPPEGAVRWWFPFPV